MGSPRRHPRRSSRACASSPLEARLRRGPGGTRLSAEELLQSIPDLRRYVRPEWEQFSNVASTALALEQWVRLARRINDLLADDSTLQGIVVTTGTDTLEELAFFLHLTVRSPRPVVLHWLDANARRCRVMTGRQTFCRPSGRRATRKRWTKACSSS